MSLWNDLATTVGQELLDISDKSPVVAIKSLKVGDFQGLTPSFTFQFFDTNESNRLDHIICLLLFQVYLCQP